MRTVRQLLADKPAEVHAVAPEAPVIEAIRLMADKSVGALVVLQGRSSADTPVSAIMTAEVLTVAPDTSVPACMRKMTERRIRHLPVVEDGRVVGVISIGDLVKAVMADQQEQLEQLQRYIAG